MLRGGSLDGETGVLTTSVLVLVIVVVLAQSAYPARPFIPTTHTHDIHQYLFGKLSGALTRWKALLRLTTDAHRHLFTLQSSLQYIFAL